MEVLITSTGDAERLLEFAQTIQTKAEQSGLFAFPPDIDMKFDQPQATVFREVSGGANGNTFDRRGRLYTCEVHNRRLTRTDRRGKVEVLIEQWEGKRLNAPNDVIVRKDGHIGLGAQERALACLERFGERVRDIPPDRVRAVGTNAFRQAKRSTDFRTSAERALGHPIEIISGIDPGVCALAMGDSSGCCWRDRMNKCASWRRLSERPTSSNRT